jgi:hypothetical protein
LDDLTGADNLKCLAVAGMLISNFAEREFYDMTLIK